MPERFLINSSFFTSNVSLSLDFDRSLLATNYPKDIPVSHCNNISIVHPFSPSYISTKYISDSHRLTIEFELVCNASFPPSKPSKIFQIYVSALYKAPIDCPIHARVSFLLPKNSRFTCPHRLLQEMIDRPTESPLPFSNSLKNSTEITRLLPSSLSNLANERTQIKLVPKKPSEPSQKLTDLLPIVTNIDHRTRTSTPPSNLRGLGRREETRERGGRGKIDKQEWSSNGTRTGPRFHPRFHHCFCARREARGRIINSSPHSGGEGNGG